MPKFLESILVAAAAGVGVGSAFYALFEIGSTVTTKLAGPVGFALGFAMAFAVAISLAVSDIKK